ncbi:Metalloprotease family, partial [Globisporangium splendens]
MPASIHRDDVNVSPSSPATCPHVSLYATRTSIIDNNIHATPCKHKHHTSRNSVTFEDLMPLQSSTRLWSRTLVHRGVHEFASFHDAVIVRERVLRSAQLRNHFVGGVARRVGLLAERRRRVVHKHLGAARAERASMEVHECDDAVHAALKQRRPKLIVDIINKVRHSHICRASLYYSLYCDNGADGVTRARVFLQHLVEEAEQGDAAGTAKKKSIDFVCIECKDDGPEGRARAFFSAPPPTIVFCANRLHSAREVEETMVHELIHAYDVRISAWWHAAGCTIGSLTLRDPLGTRVRVLPEGAHPGVNAARRRVFPEKLQLAAYALRTRTCGAIDQIDVPEPGARGGGQDVRPVLSRQESVSSIERGTCAPICMQIHGIKELFESMGTLLLFHRPENPRQFLAQHLAEIQRTKQSQAHVPFFEEHDLEAMFAAFDVTERGYITPEQYDQGVLATSMLHSRELLLMSSFSTQR